MDDYFEASLFAKPFLSAVVVAAGSSARMGGEDKQFLPIAGVPVLGRTLLAFERCETVSEIVVVTRPSSAEKVGELCREIGITKLSAVVGGGNTRAESVRNGVAAVSEMAHQGSV